MSDEIMRQQVRNPGTTEIVPLALGRARTANGGWEWFLVVNGHRLYPNASSTGVFTDPGVSVQDALEGVLRAWTKPRGL